MGYRLVNGLGLAEVRWDVAVWGDVLQAEGDALLGDSAPILVVADCADHTPFDVVLTTDGEPIERVCAASGSDSRTVEVSVDALEPSVAVVRRLVSVDGGAAQTSFGTTVDVSFVGLGQHLLRYLLVDAAGCGQEGATVVSLGPDDGSAVGDIPVTVEDRALTVGTDEALDVLLGPARDCHNEPSSGASPLDASPGARSRGSRARERAWWADDGTAVVQWSAASARTGGVSRAVFWSSGGVAHGVGDATIEGDDLPPQVWLQDPTPMDGCRRPRDARIFRVHAVGHLQL